MHTVSLIPPLVRARLEDRGRPPAGERAVSAGFAASPLGRLLLAEVEGALCRVGYADRSEQRLWRQLARCWRGAGLRRDDDWARGRAAALFCGGPQAVNVLLRGTPFQLAVWQALLGVPAGRTESYGGLARRVGRPRAARAVGGALHANPIAWLVPCHRIVAGDDALGGYGGGLERKRRLLAAEGAAAA